MAACAQIRPSWRFRMRRTVAKSNAGPFKFVGRMQPLKNAEQLIGVLHVKTRPIVPDKDEVDSPAYPFSTPISITDGEHACGNILTRLIKGSRTPDRIMAGSPWISSGKELIFHFDVPALRLGFQLLTTLRTTSFRSSRAFRSSDRPMRGKLKKIVDEGAHLMDGIDDEHPNSASRPHSPEMTGFFRSSITVKPPM